MHPLQKINYLCSRRILCINGRCSKTFSSYSAVINWSSSAAGGWLVSCLTVNKNLHMHITFDIYEDSYVWNHLLYLQMTFKITMDYFFLWVYTTSISPPLRCRNSDIIKLISQLSVIITSFFEIPCQRHRGAVTAVSHMIPLQL